ncbi:hypothetical protein Poli38472_000289 [Pythium oligandrum]|uniref:Uncharacterized protein n=1 Tax=Pythium oligandrum TaxID=41045 RepID=A0A8K1CBN4_PYTOL|nr:hypothetical protein Poli38472_000289 [Pythium oligandrum]|eukprot:TMW60247.1 hypothetical protein Poli38472_000289 [Pythium oligandrum]
MDSSDDDDFEVMERSAPRAETAMDGDATTTAATGASTSAKAPKKTKAKVKVTGGKAAAAPRKKLTTTKPRAKTKKTVTMETAVKKKRKKTAPVSPSAETTPSRRPTGMLSVIELCNSTDDEERQSSGGDLHMADDISSVDGNASGGESETSSIKTPPKKRAKKSADASADDTDEGWSDHNRWYCNICKDGGELLCCDRCPRAFHMVCLGMPDDSIPDTEWFCKMCSECLDRRRVKKESREKARLLREAEKLERDEKKIKMIQMKEDLLAQKSAQAIEHKAKRVLEMQDRILSRKKIKYKDQEEEKLGKLAENLAQTVRSVKEKLEKLEKEDAALRKKEETAQKKKKGAEDASPEDVVRSERPSPAPCTLGDIPVEYIGQVLTIWDGLSCFAHILQLSPITMDQLVAALMHKEYSPLMTEVHMCLLDLILEDREDEDYVSDDEASMDESERFRYEIQHAPLTVGVPSSNLLNSLSWPSILYNLIVAVPRYIAHCTSVLKEAVAALHTTEYVELDIKHKLALLGFLISRMYATEKVRQMLGKHVGEGNTASKEFNRAVLQDRKLALEDEKKLREKQKAELADLTDKGKGSVKTWLKNDKKGSGETASVDGDDEDKNESVDSASESELDDLNEEALTRNEEDLEKLQSDGLISRHEYLSRKKQLENQREKLRRREEEKMRKQKALEQMERKRAAAKKGIQEGLVSKDAALLKVAIEKAKECELPERIIVSAAHVLEILEAESVREDEAEVRKKKYNEVMREFFVRTEALGRDKDDCKYWIFRADQQHLFVEKPGAWSLKAYYEADGEQSIRTPSTWYCYGSQAEVKALIDSLDEKHPREGPLRNALKENLEVILEDMPVSRPGLLISDMFNDSAAQRKRAGRAPGSPDEVSDFTSWRNERRTWRKKNHLQMDIEAFQQDLLDVEAWLSKRLKELGSSWYDNGRSEWIKAVKAAENTDDAIKPLLALENEVMSFQLKAQTMLAGSSSGGDAAKLNGNSRLDGDKSDEDDDEDDEEMEDTTADDGSILWPTKKCRDRWVSEVKKAKTLATLSAGLGCFVHRLEIFGLSELNSDDSTITTRRAKSEKEKQSRKERAVKKKQKNEEAQGDEDEDEAEERNSVDDWEEDCYICTEGGELLCCDGCPRVFHFTCVGLRRVPRGKTFCHHCDSSVKPVFPVAASSSSRNTAAASKSRKEPETESEDEEEDDSDAEVNIDTGSLNASTKEDQWDVECSVCKLGGELLCCDGCPRAFHTGCIGLEAIPDDEWFCSECNLQTCGSCKKNKIRLDSHVICGSEDGSKGCDQVFHLKCAKLSAVPEDDWYCAKCRKTLKSA